MRLKKLLVIILFLFANVVFDVNAGHLCNDKADQALSGLKSWSDLRLWYENYPGCDDGYFAEGLSDFVVVSLAKRWQELPSLESEIMKSRAFKDFVLKHIDTTTDDNDLRTIVMNAKTKCPENLRSLCVEIEKNAEEAISEIKKIVK